MAHRPLDGHDVTPGGDESAGEGYRFDGLERWTSRSVAAWHEDIEVFIGYARHALGETVDPALRQYLGAYASYLESDEFGYVGALRAHLEALGRTGTATIRRG